MFLGGVVTCGRGLYWSISSRFRNASIELTAIEPGVFEVTGRVMGVAMDKVELVFQVCAVTMATDTSLILFILLCRICYSCNMRVCRL